MIAVMFEAEPAQGRGEDYLAIAARLRPLLDGIDGFLSIERFESLTTSGKILSLSFWRDEAAVAAWRNTGEHRAAQEAGRAGIFADYRLRIAHVVRDYGMISRAEAPADSRAAHESDAAPPDRQTSPPQEPARDTDLAFRYMNRWLWTKEALARAARVSLGELSDMIAHGCAPGVIYSYDSGGWWSALAAANGQAPPAPRSSPHQWFSPGALWWIRRAKLSLRHGSRLGQAAATNAQAFGDEFVRLLPLTPGAARAYPSCFTQEGALIPGAAKHAAHSEWRDWINGAYGVCLRDFSAGTCLRKSALAAVLMDHLAGEAALSDADLIDKTQELASLVTPFAPWERATGTPGKTIDVILSALDLGPDASYPFAAEA